MLKKYMQHLSQYKTILWDFDGVIMDSMPIRDKGFELVLSDYPKDQVAQLMAYHRNNGGLSRYHKFRYFFEEIRKEIISEEEITLLAGRFSKVMLENLLNPELLILDSVNFIRSNYQKFDIHIVSGSDQNELRTICDYLGLSMYFKSIHGSPTPKTELVKNLLRENNYQNESCCLIGDSVNDFEAAEVNGIDFFGYNNLLLNSFKSKYIFSFKEL
jgi:phosphoglycolate phosphatase-like HAD superfamily hydrolase